MSLLTVFVFFRRKTWRSGKADGHARQRGALTDVGMIQDLHYSDFSEELKRKRQSERHEVKWIQEKQVDN